MLLEQNKIVQKLVYIYVYFEGCGELGINWPLRRKSLSGSCLDIYFIKIDWFQESEKCKFTCLRLNLNFSRMIDDSICLHIYDLWDLISSNRTLMFHRLKQRWHLHRKTVHNPFLQLLNLNRYNWSNHRRDHYLAVPVNFEID